MHKPYIKDGITYPSVTEIISDVYNKGEGFWRWKLGGGDAKKAVAKGNKIHSLFHSIASGKPINIPEKHAELCKNFRQYINNKEILFSETRMFSKTHGFAGTPDLVCKNISGDISIEDFKTGKVQYREHCLQLAGYMLLFKDFFGPPIRSLSSKILYIDGDSISPGTPQSYTEPFEKLLWLYKWKHG